MNDFTKRVMDSIEDDDAPVSPMVGTDQGGKHVEGTQQQPQELQPTPPGRDELGYELVPFTCSKCGVIDHMPDHTREIYDRRRIHCLPCREPWAWKWKRDPEDNSRFLYPVPGGGKPRAKLGEPERRELELRANELLDAKLRRDYLVRTILKMQAELCAIEPRIVELTLREVPKAQEAVTTIENDPKLSQRQLAHDLAHDICLAIANVAKKHKVAAQNAHMKKK